MADQQTSGILNQVRDKAASQLNEQKTRATDSLGSVAQAVRQSTQHLREQQYDTVAQFVERAADQIERFSNHLRERDLNELMSGGAAFRATAAGGVHRVQLCSRHARGPVHQGIPPGAKLR